jgi:hypothetical protein
MVGMMNNTLISKLAAASLAVGSLKADKKNVAQNYDYISADKILDRAGAALAKAGVMVIPSITHEETVSVSYTDNYGKAKTRFDSTVHFAMVLADGDSQLEMPWVGRGNDFAVPDKALYKAITSGHKYFLAKILNIGIGNEDGEHEEIPAASNQAAKRQPPTAPDMDADTEELLRDAPPPDPAPAKLGSITKTQLNELHALGTAFYNGTWEEQRPILVKAATKGASESSTDLNQAQAKTLIAGIKSRLAARVIERAAGENIDLNEILPKHKVKSLDDATPVGLVHIWLDVYNRALPEAA